MGNRPLKILHVDDYVFDAELLRTGIQRGNGALEFAWAETCDEAIEKLEAGEYDCILCDYRLGPASGLDLLRDLRGKGNKVPFIIVTGHGSEKVASEALRSGADDYYSKDEAFTDSKTLLSSIKRLASSYRKMEEAAANEGLLRKRREQLEAAAAGSPEAVWSVDEELRIAHVNHVFARITGYRDRDIEGRSADEVFTPRTVRLLRALFERDQRDIPDTFELETKCSDGTSIWWEVLATWLEAGRDKPDQVYVIARNSTMKRWAQEMLVESNKFMRDTLDAIGERIAVINESGTILYCNRSWLDFGAAAGLDNVHYSQGGSVFDFLRKTAGTTEAWGDMCNCLEELFRERRMDVDLTLDFEDGEGRSRRLRLTAARLAGKSQPLAVVALSEATAQTTTVH